MAARTLYCLCCGREIKLCPHCPTGLGFVPWRTLADSVDHFKMFTVAQDYSSGKIGRERARELLEWTDTEGYEDFETPTGAVVREILDGGKDSRIQI